MFIQTEETPNPNSLKFLPGQSVMGDQQPLSFSDSDPCLSSPLARKILEIQGITTVFLGSDFITVTKQDQQDWYILKPLILGSLMDAFVNGLPILENAVSSKEEENLFGDKDDPLSRQIRELIDTRVRPAVAQDGGDIIFRGFQEGVVYLKMQGACSGCPSSSATLKSGIENMLKYYVPEVLEVQQSDD